MAKFTLHLKFTHTRVIEFFTVVQVADLRVPMTLLAPLIIPRSYLSFYQHHSYLGGAAVFSKSGCCCVCLRLLHVARLSGPDLSWTLRVAADA